MSSLRLTDFEPHLKTRFTLHGTAGPVEIRLEQARRLGQGLREGGAFALLFVGPRQPVQPQAIYPLEHEEMGRHEIFLVPVGPQEGGMGYEAVFT